MRRRQILLDEESERILKLLAQPHAGNKSLAVRETLKMRGALESILDQIEDSQSASLRRQRDRSEKGFREGRSSSWEDVKRRNHL